LDTIADWHDSLNEDDKNALRMMETLAAMFKNLCNEIETEFIRAKLDSEEKVRERHKKINSINF